MLNLLKRWRWKQGLDYSIILYMSFDNQMYVLLQGLRVSVTYLLRAVNMAKFEPNKEHIRNVLLFLFNQNNNASESRRILVETYGDSHVPTQDACVRWFRKFKRGDFDLKDKERPGQPKKFTDAALQALLDEDDTQTQQQMADRLKVGRRTIGDRLHAMGKVQKAGKWVPQERMDSDK